MDFIVEFQWEIFIFAELLSLVSLLLFGGARYIFGKRELSLIFLLLFIVLLMLEAALALVIYRETGEISSFQIVIIIFLVYACTFGINDFKKLDRWMRLKIGKWRGIDLLTEKDKYVMKRQKDPEYIAKKYRYSSLIHLLIFTVAQVIFLGYGLSSFGQAFDYLSDLSWVGTENVHETPYPNEVILGISQIWGIVFIADFIYSWSYTIFPSKQRGE
ncbi:hypothetical protein [Lentibacillus sp. CBA3610]|uniref:hypothetical protein n=1 Tax=Lentibacillus sp. CBA3610 TaxID=2518176 RepID=UPI0015956481|nr:hypothetical protein [Lentibacillus sp. CBA3610]QKY71605.1 hypothetical protein Len3610_05275 [Lentibacillus sp. CBA3610]